jgi:hypothetical protein
MAVQAVLPTMLARSAIMPGRVQIPETSPEADSNAPFPLNGDEGAETARPSCGP